MKCSMSERDSNRRTAEDARRVARIAAACTALAIFGGLGQTLSPARAAAAEAKRPNIVLIFSDDHAYQAISAYGDPRRLLETPNLDRLGKEWMRFNRCVVP